MDSLGYLTGIAIILLVGVAFTSFCNRIKISNVLFLLLAGIILQKITYNGQSLIEFPLLFISSIGTLALVMVVFDSTSRFKIKEFDTFSFRSLKLTAFSVILNLIVLSIAVSLIFNIPLSPIVFLFSALMCGTDTLAVISMLKLYSTNRVVKTLEIESILNTPIVVLLPFIIIDIMNNTTSVVSNFITQVNPLLEQVITGIGAGILMGLIIFKLMKKYYSETLSPVILIAATLFTYTLAENMGGNGVLAITTMGLFFGNIYVKEKESLHEFSSIFANTFEIMIFVLVGITISFPLNAMFIIKSIILFIVYLLIRFIAVNVSFRGNYYTWKEKIFMTLNAQKGIAVAVIALALTTLSASTDNILNSMQGFTDLMNLTLAFILYSIILSTVIAKFSGYFLKEQHVKKKKKKKLVGNKLNIYNKTVKVEEPTTTLPDTNSKK